MQGPVAPTRERIREAAAQLFRDRSGVNWNVFHADTDPNGGWAGRSIFAQPVPWNSDGTPNFGTPAGAVPYNEQAQTRC